MQSGVCAAMEIRYSNRIERHFRTESALRRTYGARRAQSIIARLLVLSDCATLSEVPTTPPERRHLLIGNREGQFAVDVHDQYRLIFVPDHDPVPQREDGGIDTDRVTAIVIIDMLDYHPRRRRG